MQSTTIMDVTIVAVPVSDQDKALEFFTGTLGFEKQLDVSLPSMRWLTVGPAGATTSIALTVGTESGPEPGTDTGIRFLVPDAEAEHTGMRAKGIEVGELLRWPGVPAMFEFRDPDGNRFEIVEATG